MAESVVKYSYNGTEYSFVTRDPAQIEDLKCPICLELVYEPVLTSCGHLFCQNCVRGQMECPTCRNELQHFRNQRDERKVKSLKVKCPNWKKGCEWQGDLGDTAQHTDTNCQMETICCPIGCKEVVLRGKSKRHAAICPKRAYKCPHCYFKDTFINVTTTHFTTCEDFPLMCPAGCSKPIPRSTIAKHLTDCTEELTVCKYASIGCQEVMKRRYLSIHLQDKKDLHLEMAMDKVMQLSSGLLEVSVTVKMLVAGEGKPNVSQLPVPFHTWLQNTPTCYPHPPWVIKMEGFQEKKENDEVWYSDPVYSHFGGYKMCFCVHANGFGIGHGTHVSVYICLMRGDNDDNLKWPFKGTIKVSLLNQLEDGQHHTVELWSPNKVILEGVRSRVTGRERAVKSYGLHKCSSHSGLNYQGGKNYLKDNTLFFRVDCFEPKLD